MISDSREHSMTRNRRRGGSFVPVFVAGTLVLVGTSNVRADWGMGFGMAFGGVAQPSGVVNQHAMIRAMNAPGGPTQNHVYAGNPNAYINKIRDDRMTENFGIRTRRSLTNMPYTNPNSNLNRTELNPSARPAETPAAAPAKAVAALASFFDASKRLVWPSDAPIAGELGEQRNASDQASLFVHELVQKYGSAPITTVTRARQKLLDYGRPALQYIRTYATPRIADTFHAFMRSLYDSLEQAANPPKVESKGN
jgi:hypothetical protein